MMRRLLGRNLGPAALLATIGMIIMIKALGGGLALYIHPRYTTLLLVAGAVLTLLALLLTRLPPISLSPAMLLLPLAVVILALAVPARPLGANLVAGKSLSDSGSDALIARWQAQRGDDSRDWTLLEWNAAIRQDALPTLKGKPASFEGFVYRKPGLPQDEVFVARYILTCCTADGTAVSMNVKGPNAASLGNDQWVRVEGSFDTVIRDGEIMPQIIGTLSEIETPDTPYLYP